MATARLTIRGLWRLYNAAHMDLEDGLAARAAGKFTRLLHAELRPDRRLANAPPDDGENPLRTRARLGLSYCYVDLAEYDLALAELRAVLDHDPHNSEALCEIAHICELTGDRPRAKELLEQAVRLAPDSPGARHALGYHLLQNDDFAAAAEQCRMAVTYDPSFELAWVELAVALSRLERFGEAVTAMQRALQLSPENPAHYQHLAVLLRDDGRRDEALQMIKSGLSVAPADAGLLEFATEMHLEHEEPEAAILWGRRLLRVLPNSPTARELLAVAFAQADEPVEALRMIDQLIHRNPLDPSNHFKKGLLFQTNGRTHEAMDSFITTIRLAGDSPLGHEASQAAEMLDREQIQQIIILATEDAVFRCKLQRDPAGAAVERGFALSDEGLSVLERFTEGYSGRLTRSRWPAVYH